MGFIIGFQQQDADALEQSISQYAQWAAECMNAGISAGMFFRVVGAGRGSSVIAHIIVGPFV